MRRWLSSPGLSSPVPAGSPRLDCQGPPLRPGDGSPGSGHLWQGMARGCASVTQGMPRRRCRYRRNCVTVGSVTVDPSCDITCLEQRLGKARLVHEWDCSLSQSLLEVDARCTGQSLHRPSAQATQRAMYTYEHCYIAIYAPGTVEPERSSVPAASPKPSPGQLHK